eukprot:1042806-Amphidinium_carterae.2
MEQCSLAHVQCKLSCSYQSLETACHLYTRSFLVSSLRLCKRSNLSDMRLGRCGWRRMNWASEHLVAAE